MTVFYLVVRFNIINTSEIDRSAIELLSTLGWISVGYDENIIETLLLYSLITGVFFMFSLWYLSSVSALEDKKEFKADKGEAIHIQLPNNARGNELRKEIQKKIESEYSDVSYEISYGVNLRIVEPNTTTTENAHT